MDIRDSLDKTIPRLDTIVWETTRRVECTLQMCERFDQMTDLLEDWARRWETDRIGKLLVGDETTEYLREQAIAGLVLKGTERARELLDAYDPGEETSRSHRLFLEIARIEFSQRPRREYTAREAS